MLVVYNEDDFSTNPLSLGHKDINLIWIPYSEHHQVIIYLSDF